MNTLPTGDFLDTVSLFTFLHSKQNVETLCCSGVKRAERLIEPGELIARDTVVAQSSDPHTKHVHCQLVCQCFFCPLIENSLRFTITKLENRPFVLFVKNKISFLKKLCY